MKIGSLKNLIFYWLPVFVYMTLIFYLSSRPKIPVSEDYVVSFIIFKTLHIIEYALLFFLLFRAFNSNFSKKVPLRHLLLASALIAAAYAATDEIHQTFVPTREGKLRDVFIDMIGILLMYSYIKHYKKYLPRFFL